MLRVALAIALVYAAITIFTLVMGPWRMEVPWRASASSADKPASVTLFFLLLAVLLSRRFHALIRRGSTATFYLLCAVVCWVLAWGPFPRLFGEAVLYQAPYAWLLLVPGFDALRAPARLWMMVVLCLVVFMGLMVARLLAAKTHRAVRIIGIVAACGLVADGLTRIPTAEVPPTVATSELQGRTVLVLPIGDVHKDIGAVYHAVMQNYRAINGYSGYEPPYYEALRTLLDAGDGRLFGPFVSRGDVDVLVSWREMGLRALIEQQPGSQLVSEGQIFHYRVPSRDVPPVRTQPAGVRVPVRDVQSACSREVGLHHRRGPWDPLGVRHKSPRSISDRGSRCTRPGRDDRPRARTGRRRVSTPSRHRDIHGRRGVDDGVGGQSGRRRASRGDGRASRNAGPSSSFRHERRGTCG